MLLELLGGHFQAWRAHSRSLDTEAKGESPAAAELHR
jgi:hypothetical protein